MATVAFQTNGVSPTTAASSTNGVAHGAAQDNQLVPSSQLAVAAPSQQPSQPQPPAPTQAPPAAASSQPSSKPRDARTMELLLTAQGVSSYEARVPQLLLDFAYRHTSAILSDAVHLSADPYTSHAGARPSASSGAAASAPASGDASVSANAVQLAIASRLAFQFRGGAGGGVTASGPAGGAAGGGASKEWLLELARERNKVALPRVGAVEWGARLPSERFVLSGVAWGLRESWASGAADADEDGEEDDENEGLGGGGRALAGKEDGADGDVTMADEDVGGDGVEGGTMTDVFADDGMMEDEEMGME